MKEKEQIYPGLINDADRNKLDEGIVKLTVQVANSLTSGFLAGIDHSRIMFKQASKRNKEQITERKVKLECGTVWDLSYPDSYFDIIYGSNVHIFWENPVKEFKGLAELLKPGGRLVMVF